MRQEWKGSPGEAGTSKSDGTIALRSEMGQNSLGRVEISEEVDVEDAFDEIVTMQMRKSGTI
jgi:hypothetical protein